MLVDQSLDFLFPPTDGAAQEARPAEELQIDMYERDDAIVVRALAPGISPEQLHIAFEGDQLIISGIRSEIEEVARDRFFHQECSWGFCSRAIMIPGEIDSSRIRAHIQHGVVCIELPKIV